MIISMALPLCFSSQRNWQEKIVLSTFLFSALFMPEKKIAWAFPMSPSARSSETSPSTCRIFSLNSACIPRFHALHIGTYSLEHLDPRNFRVVHRSPVSYSFLSCIFYGCANRSETTVSSQCITQKDKKAHIKNLSPGWDMKCISWGISDYSSKPPTAFGRQISDCNAEPLPMLTTSSLILLRSLWDFCW